MLIYYIWSVNTCSTDVINMMWQTWWSYHLSVGPRNYHKHKFQGGILLNANRLQINACELLIVLSIFHKQLKRRRRARLDLYLLCIFPRVLNLFPIALQLISTNLGTEWQNSMIRIQINALFFFRFSFVIIYLNA